MSVYRPNPFLTRPQVAKPAPQMTAEKAAALVDAALAAAAKKAEAKLAADAEKAEAKKTADAKKAAAKQATKEGTKE